MDGYRKVRKSTRQDLAAAPNYARFYISALFPRLRRFIYLDNDVIAVQPLDDLWRTSLGPHLTVGMVHDCGSWFYDHVVTHNNYNLSHPAVRDVFGDTITTALNYSCRKKHCTPSFSTCMLVSSEMLLQPLPFSALLRCVDPNAGVMLVDQQRFLASEQLQKIERLIQLNQEQFVYKLGE